MMPFSPEFLREIKAQAGPDTGKKEGTLPRTSSTASISSKNADILPSEPLEGQDRMFHAYKLSDSCVLIGCEEDTFNLFITGFCHVVALKGDVAINGYTLPVSSDKHRVCNPIWQPAYPVCNVATPAANSTSASSYKTPSKATNATRRSNIESYLEHHQISCSGASVGKFKGSAKTSNLFGEFTTVFGIEGMDSSDQEWLVASEDQSMYKDPVNNPSKPDNRGIITVHTTPAMALKKTSLVRVGSAMMGNFTGMNSARADCMTVPPSWMLACDKLATQFGTGREMSVAICGAKGVGKSTCLRYVVNKLLSVSEGLQGPKATSRLSIGGAYSNKKNNKSGSDGSSGGTDSSVSMWATSPSVCVIDCDLGQPELSVPGSVSLHIVSCTTDSDGISTGSFLSAPHLNMQTPELSYFLGDLTSKHEPQLVSHYVQLLLQRYQEIVAEVAALQEQSRKAATKKFVQSNAFNALMLLDGSDASDSEIDSATNDAPNTTNTTSSTSASTALPIPLVINLDGYVKNMGAEVLESILRMALPSHVVHICSDRDRSLLPLESILNVASDRIESEVGSGTSAAPVSAVKGSSTGSAGTAGSGVDATVDVVKEKTSEVLILEPGRYYTTPRLAAVDLRSLRLVSYFLRTDPEIRPYVRESSGLVRSSNLGSMGGMSGTQRSGSAGNLAALDNTTSSGVYGGGAGSYGEGVTLRNGSVGHPQGLLALRMLSMQPYAIPFSCASLCSIPAAGDLPARLVLAAMNAAVVGIVTYTTKDNKDTKPAKAETNEQLRELHVSGKKRLRLSESEFEISCPTTYPIAHCVGLGVIRGVDIPNQRLLLTTPVAESVLLAPNTRLCLIKGSALQLPATLTYAPTFPVFPYMSSESTGEGSAQLRTRNNVKRRGQQ